MGVEERLKELNIELPQAAAPVASYVPTVEAGNTLYISGQISIDADGKRIVGHLGRDLSIEEGKKAAERCALMVLAQVKAALGGSFGRVERIAKVNVFVQSAPDCTDQSAVANGASDLFVHVFGEAGRHARAAIGVAALPLGVAVEVDATIQLR